MAAPFGNSWSYAAGEIAPSLWGRTNLAKYQIGLATCRNAFVSYRGAAYSRPGTLFVGYSKQTIDSDIPPRLITFNFSINQALMLEFGNLYMRVVSDGGFVLERAFTITAASGGTPEVLTIPGHNFVVGDWIFVSSNNLTFVISAVAGNNVSITDVFGTPISPLVFGAFVAGSTAARVFTLPTPWTAIDLKFLKFTQSADVMSICLWNQDTNAAIFATGAITFAVNPSNGDTITLNGVSWEFVAAAPVGNQTQIQSTLALTLAELAMNLSASVNPLLTVAGYFATATMLDIVFGAEGTTGNSYTLAASAATPSATSLTGGNVSYPSFDLERVSDTDWVLTELSTASSIPAPTSVTVTASTSSIGSGTPPTQYATVVTYVDIDTGEESQASPVGLVSNSVDIGATAGSLKILWPQGPPRTFSNIYQAEPAVGPGAHVPDGALFGFLASTAGTSYTDSNVIADFDQVPPLHQNPFAAGAIQSVTVVDGGTGIAAVTFMINTKTGSGFVGTAIVDPLPSGSLVAIVVDNGGQNYQPGDSIVIDGAGFATGAIVFSVNPSNGDTITLNGVVWTFVTSGAIAHETNIQATLALTMVQLASDVSAALDAPLTVANYQALPSPSQTNLTITFNTAGTAGDAYTLAASVAVPSGPTLTGGSGSGTLSATLIVGPETGTFPSVAAYFQQRRVYASTPNAPDNLFLSQPGLFTNFDSRIPTIDSDAIIANPWSTQVNGVQFMIPMPGGLVTMTGLQAWQVAASGSSALSQQAITPANIQAQSQTFNGCSNYMPPIQKDFQIIYLESLGSIFCELSYNLFTNNYSRIDVTYLSSHLFSGFTMKEAAWCEEPFKLIHVVREDGLMLVFTYFKEQDVMAWTRYDTQGLYTSVTSVPEPPVNALYLCSQRTVNSQNAFMIERQNNRNWNGVETTWCVDAGLSLNQPMPAASITINSLGGLQSCTGFSSFSGGSSYSQETTGVIQDPTGTGAAVALTIVDGVIQEPTFTSGGFGYTNPSFKAIDPTGSGDGRASGVIQISNMAAVVASAAVFNAGQVGWVIRAASGIAVITAFIDSEHVTVQIRQPFVTTQAGATFQTASAGNWTLTEPVSSVQIPHLTGATVTGIADGKVITPRVVGAGGFVMLDAPASQVLLGLPFQVQIQTLRPETSQPTGQMQRKKIGGVSVRVEGSLGFEVGTNQPDGSAQSPIQFAPLWSNLQPAYPPGAPLGLPPYGQTVAPLFTGDIRVDQLSGWDKQGQVALQQSLPLPLQLLAVVTEFLEGDTADVAVSARAPGSTAPSGTPFTFAN